MDWLAVETAAVGLLSGYASGQLGVGGGILATPAIRVLLGYPAMIAVGTPLLVIVPTVITSAVEYARADCVDWRLAGRAGATGVPGAIAGAYMTRFIPGGIILLATAVLMVVAAVGVARGRDVSESRHESRDGPVWPEYAAGLGAGLFSGFFGLGGGLVLVPAFAGPLGRGVKVAFGTSLVVICVLSLPGAVVHWLLGHVDLRLAALLVAGAIPGAWLGAHVATRMPERTLRLAFAVFVALFALVLGGSEIAGILS